MEQFICWEVCSFSSDVVHWWLLSGGDRECKSIAVGHFSGGAVLGSCVVKCECVMEECNHCPVLLGNACSEDIKWKGEVFCFLLWPFQRKQELNEHSRGFLQNLCLKQGKRFLNEGIRTLSFLSVFILAWNITDYSFCGWVVICCLISLLGPPVLKENATYTTEAFNENKISITS